MDAEYYKKNCRGDNYIKPLANSLSAKLWYLNFHQPEVVCRYRDPQLQVGEHYS